MVPAFPEGSGSLPEVLYRLLDPAAAVELPAPGAVQLRASDNRELDKLVAALGRNKSTWRRALMLHEWLLEVGAALPWPGHAAGRRALPQVSGDAGTRCRQFNKQKQSRPPHRLALPALLNPPMASRRSGTAPTTGCAPR